MNIFKLGFLLGACTLLLLPSCQPDASQSQQRIQELMSENSKDKARLDTLNRQLEALSGTTKELSEKLDKLLGQGSQPTAAATPAAAAGEAEVGVALSKLVQRLQPAVPQGGQVKGYAHSINAVVVIRTGESANAMVVPFAKAAEGDDWAALISDDQIIASITKPAAAAAAAPVAEGPGSSLRVRPETGRDPRRPPPLRIGDAAPSGSDTPAVVEPSASATPKTGPSTAPTGDSSKVIPEGGAQFIEKNGRKVLRLQP